MHICVYKMWDTGQWNELQSGTSSRDAIFKSYTVFIKWHVKRHKICPFSIYKTVEKQCSGMQKFVLCEWPLRQTQKSKWHCGFAFWLLYFAYIFDLWNTQSCSLSQKGRERKSDKHACFVKASDSFFPFLLSFFLDYLE